MPGKVRIICNSELDPDDVKSARAAAMAMRREWCSNDPERMAEKGASRFERLYRFLNSGKPRCTARRSFSRCPTATIASIAGFNSQPRSVREYSTVGGEVGFTVRSTTPSTASFFNRVDSTLADTPLRSPFNSLKVLGECPRYQMMPGVHAPPMMPRHSRSGQVSGGGTTLFFLRGTMK